MKLEITQPGVYDGEGKRIPVGAEVTVKGDGVPAWLMGKCRVVSKPNGKVAVTNPAKGATKAKAD